jgi:hypothetical protein
MKRRLLLLVVFLLPVGTSSIEAQAPDTVGFRTNRTYTDFRWWTKESDFTAGVRVERSIGYRAQYFPGQGALAASIEHNREQSVLTLTVASHVLSATDRWDPFIGLGLRIVGRDPYGLYNTRIASVLDVGLRFHVTQRLNALVLIGGVFGSSQIGIGTSF